MLRGTTPTHYFYLPLDASMIKDVEITYAQDNVKKLTKRIGECMIDETATVSVRLTQEETFLFNGGSCVQVQIRVLTTGGDVVGSLPMRVRCDVCFSDEVLK